MAKPGSLLSARGATTFPQALAPASRPGSAGGLAAWWRNVQAGRLERTSRRLRADLRRTTDEFIAAPHDNFLRDYLRQRLCELELRIVEVEDRLERVRAAT